MHCKSFCNRKVSRRITKGASLPIKPIFQRHKAALSTPSRPGWRRVHARAQVSSARFPTTPRKRWRHRHLIWIKMTAPLPKMRWCHHTEVRSEWSQPRRRAHVAKTCPTSASRSSRTRFIKAPRRRIPRASKSSRRSRIRSTNWRPSWKTRIDWSRRTSTSRLSMSDSRPSWLNTKDSELSDSDRSEIQKCEWMKEKSSKLWMIWIILENCAVDNSTSSSHPPSSSISNPFAGIDDLNKLDLSIHQIKIVFKQALKNNRQFLFCKRFRRICPHY